MRSDPNSCERAARAAVRALLAAVLALGTIGALGAPAEPLRARFSAEPFDTQTFGLPIGVESAQADSVVSAEVLGFLPYGYGVVRGALAETANWCEFLPLVLNIKACLHGAGETPTVTLFAGRKFYQPPEAAHRIDYRFAREVVGDDYLRLRLAADSGPLGTRDYRIVVEALPAPEGTYLRLSLGYRTSLVSRLAVGTYLGTLGRHKVGFSVIDRQQGEPVYIGGVRGIIERNVVRYYLALKAFLDTRGLPDGERQRAAREAWYRETARFPRQLQELGRDEYLGNKRREYANQRRLQS